MQGCRRLHAPCTVRAGGEGAPHALHRASEMTSGPFRRRCAWFSCAEATEPGWKHTASVLAHGSQGSRLVHAVRDVKRKLMLDYLSLGNPL